eukprot:357911-Chlamydomonas_euryale.AAC.1
MCRAHQGRPVHLQLRGRARHLPPPPQPLAVPHPLHTCADPIKAGQFICCYVGLLITEPMAERRNGRDQYLFGLDHFSELLARGSDEDIPAYQLPPAPSP